MNFLWNSDLDKKIDRTDQLKIDRWKIRNKRSEDSSTVEAVLDIPTSKIIHTLLGKGIIGEITGNIAMGKEAAVYDATVGPNFTTHFSDLSPPKRVVLKVYRTRTLDFRHIDNYIAGDVRFQKIGKGSVKKIKIWAQKEFKNLLRAYEANVLVPCPYIIQRNVLLMEQVQYNNKPAPLLKEVHFEEEEIVSDLFDELISGIQRLYQEAHLVHADLSPYNILISDDVHPIMIDMGQSVHITHPNAKRFLIRDLRNILNYFAFNIHNVPTIEGLFKDTTGELPSVLDLEEI